MLGRGEHVVKRGERAFVFSVEGRDPSPPPTPTGGVPNAPTPCRSRGTARRVRELVSDNMYYGTSHVNDINGLRVRHQNYGKWGYIPVDLRHLVPLRACTRNAVTLTDSQFPRVRAF